MSTDYYRPILDSHTIEGKNVATCLVNYNFFRVLHHYNAKYLTFLNIVQIFILQSSSYYKNKS